MAAQGKPTQGTVGKPNSGQITPNPLNANPFKAKPTQGTVGKPTQSTVGKPTQGTVGKPTNVGAYY